MTVENTNNTISYTGNGSVDTFAYNFLTYSADHLFIYFDAVLQSSGFTITGVGDDNGGNVVFSSPPDSGVTIRIDRTVPDTQLLEYQEYGPFPAKANERGLDLVTMAVQQNARDIGRGYDRLNEAKMDKQPLAIEANIVVFDSEGNAKDSGVNIDNSGVITDLNKVIPFNTLDEAVNETSPLKIFNGAALNLKERSTGNGGGAMWDAVLTSTVTPNGFDIVQSSVIPALSLKLRVIKNEVSAEQYGVAYKGGDQSGAHNSFIAYCILNDYTALINGVIDASDTIMIPDGAKVIYSGVTNHSITTNTVYPTDLSRSAGYRLIADAGRTTYTKPSVTGQIATGGQYTDSGGGTHTLLDLSTNYNVGVDVQGVVNITGSMTIYAKNGIDYEGYNDDASLALSDDIDVGLVLNSVSRSVIDNVYVIGHYRKAGTLLLSVATAQQNQSSERNNLNKLVTMGMRGLCVRSEDQGGSIGNFGLSQTVINNLECTDLDHPTALRAKDLSAGFTEASKAIEISGDKIRGLQIISATIQGRDDCLMHLHDCIDLQFIATYFESKTARSVIGGAFDVPSGSLVLASPFDSANGQETNKLQMISMRKSSNVDFRPYWSDSVSGSSRFTSGGFSPRSCNIDTFNNPIDTGGDYVIRPRSDGGNIEIQDRQGNTVITVFGSSGNIEVSGVLAQESSGSDLDLKCQEGRSVKLVGGSDDLLTAVESTGNVIIEKGSILPSTDNNKDAGSTTSGFRKGYFNQGVVIKSPNGTSFTLQVDDSGNITAT